VDFNQDGIKDLAALDRGGDILLGNGDGTFYLGPSIPLRFGQSVRVIGDFNNDGKLDLLATNCNPFNHGCSEALLLGNGDGTFAGMPGLNLLRLGADTPADFDGDGKLDLGGGILLNGQTVVVVSTGKGDGTFQPPETFPVSTNVRVKLAEDLNRDKAPDLVVINSNNSIGVLLNSGTDFSIFASTPAPSTLSAGQSATSTVTVKLLNGFDNPVSLACVVQATQVGSPTCSLDTQSVTFDGSGKASTTLIIRAGSPEAALRTAHPCSGSSEFPLRWLPIVGVACIGAELARSTSTMKRRHFLFALCTLLGGLAFLAACGGGTSRPAPPTSRAITVTGTSGFMQHSATVSVTVQ
jgi:hypothetical protein